MASTTSESWQVVFTEGMRNLVSVAGNLLSNPPPDHMSLLQAEDGEDATAFMNAAAQPRTTRVDKVLNRLFVNSNVLVLLGIGVITILFVKWLFPVLFWLGVLVALGVGILLCYYTAGVRKRAQQYDRNPSLNDPYLYA